MADTVKLIVPSVIYKRHANDRAAGVLPGFEAWREGRTVGFAPWPVVSYSTADDPDETFAEQEARLRHILDLPDDDEA
jgi:hypothetical protein